MSDLAPSWLVCPAPLANAKRRPAATLWRTCPDNLQVMMSWLSSEDFRALVQMQPQVWSADLVGSSTSECRRLVESVGGIVAEPGQIVHADSTFPTALPDGAQWVQGRWYHQPPGDKANAQEASRALVVQLINRLIADADTSELERLFRQDARLSYQLLRLVNSAAFAPRRPITSFAQAILILGRQQLRRWLNLLLFASRRGDVRSPMLTAQVVLRSRLMELLAHEAGLERIDQDQVFMVGMFSLLPVLFGQSLDEVLSTVNLGQEITDALYHNQGRFALLLQSAEACEQGDVGALARHLEQLSISAEKFNQVATRAVRWAVDVSAASVETNQND